MRRYCTLPVTMVLIGLLLFSCSGPKDPTFKKVENIRVKSITGKQVTITGDVVLHNPNAFSCHLKNLHLDIFSEKDILLTEMDQAYNTEMVANEDFKLPVQISFAPDKLLKEKDGLLNSIMNVLSDQEVLLKCKGYCDVEAMEISVKVPVEFEERVTLKL